LWLWLCHLIINEISQRERSNHLRQIHTHSSEETKGKYSVHALMLRRETPSKVSLPMYLSYEEILRELDEKYHVSTLLPLCSAAPVESSVPKMLSGADILHSFCTRSIPYMASVEVFNIVKSKPHKLKICSDPLTSFTHSFLAFSCLSKSYQTTCKEPHTQKH